MADQTKRRSRQQADSLMDFEAHELQATMQEFLKEEKKSNTNIWNFATIAGIAMFFVAIVYIFQMIGLSIGPDVSGVVGVLPLIGGIIVTLVGFGFFVRDRKKKKKNQTAESFDYDYDYDFEENTGSKEEEGFTLENDLGSKGKSNDEKKSSTKERFDRYAFSKSKKLYRSRTDKKIAGVCGGLAKYFGINAGVIRALFVITLFAAGGTSLLIYIALAIALDKEPPEMMDDFNF
ncbi:PspC domain-containing protein [Fodinibius sp. Rm-B-1B1-1]|uniref:PspC domain-containing protein n=1 Tax=Fodinibius alkaliphilus TaxID=3140241 RepID=UPI00315AE49B